MSQLAATTNGQPAGSPAGKNGAAAPSAERIAVLHRQGERWRFLVAERRGLLGIVEARTLAGTDPWSAIAEARERHGFGRLIVVAPGRATVARAAGLPAGANDELASAAALMGEAQLPESLPMHRRAAGVVADVDRPGFRTALLTGWAAGDPQVIPPPPESLEDLVVTWTTPIAALSALRSEFGAALYADPHDGAVSMIAGGTERTFARVLVEDAAHGFWRSVSQVAGETAAAVGVPVPQVGSGAVGPALRLDARSVATLKDDVRDLPDRAEWLNDYGIALGAALVATSPDPLVRPLAEMLESAPIIREPLHTRVTNWLAVPRHAWAVIGIAVAVMLLSPLAFGAARLWLVDLKARGGAERLNDQDQSIRQQAMIDQLDASRWPMTKLMADVSDCVPEGIVVESLRIAADSGVTLQGTANSADAVSALQSNLNATKLFSNLKLIRIDSTGSSVEFNLSADVVNPYFPAKPTDDWAAKPLAVRLYGEGASNTATPTGGSKSRRAGGSESSAPRENGRRAARERSGDSDSGDRPARGREARESRAERPSEASAPAPKLTSADAPKPLTDEEVNAMTNVDDARREMVKRRLAASHGADASLRTRLNGEADRLRDRINSLSSSGSSAKSPASSGATGPTSASGATGSSGGGKP